MIVAELKPLEEILAAVCAYPALAVVGCGGCVAVCLSGGEKEAQRLASLLRLAAQGEGRAQKIDVLEQIRQCDTEFIEASRPTLARAGAILSLACGAGVQFLAEKFPNTPVLPALNTSFLGVNRELGYWTEMCQGCGNCLLEATGGICPVARCAKSHFNGPCGGSQNGLCEVDSGTDCAWQLIYERLQRLGQAEKLLTIHEVRNWQSAVGGQVRSIHRADVAQSEE